MLIALVATAAALALTPADTTTVLLPTSQALHMAERVARAEGYDLSDRRRYFFDLINNNYGRPFLSGYITFGFYWDGDTVSTISINERTGVTVDPVACKIFDYPPLRTIRAEMKANGAPPKIMEDLKAQSGCESFRTVRNPDPIRRR